MRSRQDVVRTLAGPRQVLWRSETKHEAILLLASTLKRFEDTRDELIHYVLAGPPLLDQEREEDNRDWQVIEILSYLSRQGIPLNQGAAGFLESRKLDFAIATDVPPDQVGMRYRIGVRERMNRFSIDEVLAVNPSKMIDELVVFEGDIERTRRDFAETIGWACAKNTEWGIEAWKSLIDHAQDLNGETSNPLFWGFASGLRGRRDGERLKGLEGVDGERLIAVWDSLVRTNPDPELWYSMPQTLQELRKAVTLDATQVDQFVMSLLGLFRDFDFEGEKADKPVEWLNRAINHPVGNLVDWFLDLAQNQVSDQVRNGKPVSLDQRFLRVFNAVVDGEGQGARYGLCLLSSRFSWLEAVAPDWCEERLLASFSWIASPDQAEIAWSGYLWGRNLSRLLKDDFENSYVGAARNYKRLASEERKGLMSHVAGVCWFERAYLKELKEIAGAVDRDERCHLFDCWENHLAASQPSDSEAFFDAVLFPYWDWCARQAFFSVPDGDPERQGFLILVPHARGKIVEAYDRAMLNLPSRIEHAYGLVRAMQRDDTWEFPETAVRFLVAVLGVAQRSNFARGDWKEVFNKAEQYGPSNIDDLRNALARAGISE